MHKWIPLIPWLNSMKYSTPWLSVRGTFHVPQPLYQRCPWPSCMRPTTTYRNGSRHFATRDTPWVCKSLSRSSWTISMCVTIGNHKESMWSQGSIGTPEPDLTLQQWNPLGLLLYRSSVGHVNIQCSTRQVNTQYTHTQALEHLRRPLGDQVHAAPRHHRRLVLCEKW
jgi:hypothetical protein